MPETEDTNGKTRGAKPSIPSEDGWGWESRDPAGPEVRYLVEIRFTVPNPRPIVVIQLGEE